METIEPQIDFTSVSGMRFSMTLFISLEDPYSLRLSVFHPDYQTLFQKYANGATPVIWTSDGRYD